MHLPWYLLATIAAASIRDGCFRSGRLVFCRTALVNPPPPRTVATESFRQSLTVEITVKDSRLAEKLLSGDWAPGALGEMARERLSLRGPLSSKSFDEDGRRFVEVALPSKGRWARWKIKDWLMLSNLSYWANDFKVCLTGVTVLFHQCLIVLFFLLMYFHVFPVLV